METEKIHDIYVFGDSHYNMFFASSARIDEGHTIKCYKNIRFIDTPNASWPGSTMFGLLHDNSKSHVKQNLREMLDSKPENTLCVYGEVDIRKHLYKHRNDRSVDETVREAILRYELFLNDFVKPYVRNKMIIVGGIPSLMSTCNANSGPNLDPPIYTYTQSMERQIEDMCKKNGFEFLSILYDVVPDGMYPPQEAFQDDVHLHCENIFPIVAEKVCKIMAP